MAVIPEAIKYVAIIYKPSFFVAVAPEAIKYVAFIYKPSLTCRHLHADHSGTQKADCPTVQFDQCLCFQVVQACLAGGAHHIDISGEPQFLEKIQLKYHKEAEAKGVYVIGACGFDSIPSDMGRALVHKEVRRTYAKFLLQYNLGAASYMTHATYCSVSKAHL